MNSCKKNSIAIVGMGFRLPNDISTCEALWQVLVSGENLISQIDERRFCFENYLHSRKTEPGKSYTFSAGVLSKIDEFDANFFGITPREACQIDPQQRLLLEVTWEALDNGAQNVDQLAGTDCAVYIGIGSNEHMFQYVNDSSISDSYTMLGSCSSIASNRISYIFDLHGPSMSVDTACSSSLVALHQACNSLWSGEASSAIVGGVNLLQSPTSFVGFSKASMLSPDGQCKSFAAEGNGYVRSEGCVVLFLKPLEVAERDGDPIHAVILGTGVNSDGRTKGIILPSSDFQAALITQVHESAGVSVNDIRYIEAHGTGTAVGDRTESLAIGIALASKRESNNPLLMGSIKSNLGHLEVASGLTGLLKTVLCLQHKIIPPTLHHKNPNPDIDFLQLNLKVVDVETKLLEQTAPVIMAVNSFGFGGTNAHVLLAEYVTESESSEELFKQQNTPPLVLSTRDDKKYVELAKQYLEFFRHHSSNYYDIAYTLSYRRSSHEKGMLIYGDNLAAIIHALEQVANGSDTPNVVKQNRIGNHLSVALVYSGNGSQWQGMGAELIQYESIFIDTIDEIDALYLQYADFSIKQELLVALANSRFDNTEIAQPCIFALQVALTRYLLKQGVQVTAVAGHSVGEIAAAWACGALTLAQATEVIYKRSFWQGTTRGHGRMMAVALSEADAEELILSKNYNQVVHIAATNSHNGVTLAGNLFALEELQFICQEKGIFNRLLDLDYAFHSPYMECIREGLLSSLSTLEPQNNKILYISTVTGSELPGEHLDADYWWQNIRQPVRFKEAIDSLLDSGIQIFIEVGPHAVLKPYIEESIRVRDIRGGVISTCQRNAEQVSELKNTVFKIWMSGAQFDKTSFFPTPGQITTLPPYLWTKESYRLAPSLENANHVDLPREHPLLGRRIKHDESIWENHLDTTLVSYLADHLVNGVAVMPAAGYAEMAIAASKLWYGNQHHDLTDIEILSPMLFEETSSRLVRFELQPQDGRFLIKSRRRHSGEEWGLHVVGRVVPEPVNGVVSAKMDLDGFRAEEALVLSGMDLYSAAETVGLTYGRCFQMISQLWIKQSIALASIDMHLDITRYIETHSLYPGLLDACFQLLIGLLFYNDSNRETVLPVRLGRLRLFRALPQEMYLTAEILSKSKQSVLACFSILDNEGEVIATMSDCRFKKVYFSEQMGNMKTYTCKPHLLASYKLSPAMSFTDLQLLQQTIKTASSISQQTILFNQFESVQPLIDLMVSYFIYDAVIEFSADQQLFSVSSLVDGANIAPTQHLFLKWCLNVLLEDGLVEKNAEGLYFLVVQDEEINPYAVWLLLLKDYPYYLTEILFAGRIGLNLKAILRGNLVAEDLLYPSRKNDALKYFIEDAPSVSGIHEVVCEAFSLIVTAWPMKRRMKVLDIGYSVGALSSRLIHQCLAENTDYYLLVADENAPQYIEGQSFVRVTTGPVNTWFTNIEQWDNQQFDVIIIRNYLHEVDNLAQAAMQLKNWIANDGVLLLSGQSSERLYEFVLGSQVNWWHQTITDQPLSRLSMTHDFKQHLLANGFQFTETMYEASGSAVEGGFLLVAQPCNGPQSSDAVEEAYKPFFETLLCVESVETLDLIYPAFHHRMEELSCLIVQTDEADLSELQERLTFFSRQEKALRLVWFFENDISLLKSAASCTRIISLTKLIQSIDWKIYPQLTLVTSGAVPANVDDAFMINNPVHATVWGLGRVLVNEHPSLKCKLIELQGKLNVDLLENFVKEIFTNDHENEIIVTASARYGLRADFADPFTSQKNNSNDAYYLDFKHSGSLNNLYWYPVTPSALAPDEVRVKPYAAGLNFRDVMYAMGLIPDEAVENGFLGATLGMEFAGQIIEVGDSVTNFHVGERVMGFAPASFASMTTTKAHVITSLPSQWSYSAAATVPIAFFTAYYALQHLAGLQAGERVLIHGAAGGVGIAAIQIANYLGAKVYATAGSAEKRDFLKLMGVTHCYDSRTLLFADEILVDTHDGVDVVLNCLAGEAIHANLSIIKPFGRFLELGKRDFFANTQMGLRPFRNNISYFGIDADQLLMKNKTLCVRLFKEMMGLFEANILTPLPYREFSTQCISDTFRYMQQARHIGKIVVNLAVPPATQLAPSSLSTSLVLSAEASYLVTGGLSGFGLKTAQWLVDKGARYLVLVGRSGASSPEAKQALSVFKQQGVSVLVYALDVGDAPGVNAMISTIESSFAPIKGVIHAAAVYDDALIQNLTYEKMDNVLRPKAYGAWNLHLSTQKCVLDFFVVYSSVTTLFGNPGQANYVAANAYLESLILHRRSVGLTGLYVAWGPIADAGYLTRNEKIKDMLAAKIGGQLLSASQAFQWLEKIMLKDVAGITLAHLNVSKMQHSLSSFASPKFERLIHYDNFFGELSAEASDDIRILIVDKSENEALAIISNILTCEIAKILRLPMEKIDQKESLLNLGMDSLVGSELAYAIEQRFSVQLPMMALSQAVSVQVLASRILKRLHTEEDEVHINGNVVDLVSEASLHGEEISVELALELMDK